MQRAKACYMSFTTDDLDGLTSDPDADTDMPLGDALSELAVDADVDPVAAVRELREDV